MLQRCQGCLGEYGQCYRCGRWFIARKLNGLGDEMLAEVFTGCMVADLLEHDGAPEVVCSGCEDEFGATSRA